MAGGVLEKPKRSGNDRCEDTDETENGDVENGPNSFVICAHVVDLAECGDVEKGINSFVN